MGGSYQNYNPLSPWIKKEDLIRKSKTRRDDASPPDGYEQQEAARPVKRARIEPQQQQQQQPPAALEGTALTHATSPSPTSPAHLLSPPPAKVTLPVAPPQQQQQQQGHGALPLAIPPILEAPAATHSPQPTEKVIVVGQPVPVLEEGAHQVQEEVVKVEDPGIAPVEAPVQEEGSGVVPVEAPVDGEDPGAVPIEAPAQGEDPGVVPVEAPTQQEQADVAVDAPVSILSTSSSSTSNLVDLLPTPPPPAVSRPPVRVNGVEPDAGEASAPAIASLPLSQATGAPVSDPSAGIPASSGAIPSLSGVRNKGLEDSQSTMASASGTALAATTGAASDGSSGTDTSVILDDNPNPTPPPGQSLPSGFDPVTASPSSTRSRRRCSSMTMEPTVAPSSSNQADAESSSSVSDGPNTTGIIAGSITGAAVLIGLILFLIIFCWRRRRRQSSPFNSPTVPKRRSPYGLFSLKNLFSSARGIFSKGPSSVPSEKDFPPRGPDQDSKFNPNGIDFNAAFRDLSPSEKPPQMFSGSTSGAVMPAAGGAAAGAAGAAMVAGALPDSREQSPSQNPFESAQDYDENGQPVELDGQYGEGAYAGGAEGLGESGAVVDGSGEQMDPNAAYAAGAAYGSRSSDGSYGGQRRASTSSSGRTISLPPAYPQHARTSSTPEAGSIPPTTAWRDSMWSVTPTPVGDAPARGSKGWWRSSGADEAPAAPVAASSVYGNTNGYGQNTGFAAHRGTKASSFYTDNAWRQTNSSDNSNSSAIPPPLFSSGQPVGNPFTQRPPTMPKIPDQFKNAGKVGTKAAGKARGAHARQQARQIPNNGGQAGRKSGVSNPAWEIDSYYGAR